jgi:integrase
MHFALTRWPQNAERLRAGSHWQDNNLVFSTTAGKPLNFRNVATTSFKPLLKKAGLPDIRFHDLRHTCAMLLLSRGHHPKLVQELLGHASVAMTLDRYSHVLPGMGSRPQPQWRLPYPKEPLPVTLVY